MVSPTFPQGNTISEMKRLFNDYSVFCNFVSLLQIKILLNADKFMFHTRLGFKFHRCVCVFFRMRLEYKNGRYSAFGSGEEINSCLFAAGERITNVTVFMKTEYSFQLVYGLNFHTSLDRVCEFGSSSDNSTVLSGHQLLYLSGRRGLFIDGIAPHFDYDCN